MTISPKLSADRLAAETAELAFSLSSFTTLDWIDRIGPAVQRSKEKFLDLQRQRDLLILSRADAEGIDWVFQALHARLDFLQRLHAAMCEPGPLGCRHSEPEHATDEAA